MSDKSKGRPFETFIGIDLGGGKGKNTAVAILQGAGSTVRVCFVGAKDPSGRPFYDGPLLELISGHGAGTLLAIGAPLTLTACVRCRLPRCVGLDACDDRAVTWLREQAPALVLGTGRRTNGKPVATPYTQRVCEVLMHRRHGIQPRETLGQGMGPLTARAHYLRRALEGQFELNGNLIEVYPKATLHALVGAERARRYKREVNTWKTRAEILEAFGDRLRFEIWREGCLSNDHCFDALICAYTGYLWATEGWSWPAADDRVFSEDGWIWFPPEQS